MSVNLIPSTRCNLRDDPKSSKTLPPSRKPLLELPLVSKWSPLLRPDEVIAKTGRPGRLIFAL